MNFDFFVNKGGECEYVLIGYRSLKITEIEGIKEKDVFYLMTLLKNYIDEMVFIYTMLYDTPDGFRMKSIVISEYY